MGAVEPSSVDTHQLLRRCKDLERENEALGNALASLRIIEQAKGVLAVLLDRDPESALALLREACPSDVLLADAAEEIVATRSLPGWVGDELAVYEPTTAEARARAVEARTPHRLTLSLGR